MVMVHDFSICLIPGYIYVYLLVKGDKKAMLLKSNWHSKSVEQTTSKVESANQTWPVKRRKNANESVENHPFSLTFAAVRSTPGVLKNELSFTVASAKT